VWDAVFNSRPTRVKSFASHRGDDTTTVGSAPPVITSIMNEKDRNKQKSKLTAADEAAMVKWRELHNLFSDTGECDKLVEGLFHNYPNVRINDPTFLKTVECADWIAYADVMAGRRGGDEQSSLMHYVSLTGIALHNICAGPRKPRLELPHVMYENRVKRDRNLNIARSFLCPGYHIYPFIHIFHSSKLCPDVLLYV
jgi:hypothetical protein